MDKEFFILYFVASDALLSGRLVPCKWNQAWRPSELYMCIERKKDNFKSREVNCLKECALALTCDLHIWNIMILKLYLFQSQYSESADPKIHILRAEALKVGQQLILTRAKWPWSIVAIHIKHPVIPHRAMQTLSNDCVISAFCLALWATFSYCGSPYTTVRIHYMGNF